MSLEEIDGVYIATDGPNGEALSRGTNPSEVMKQAREINPHAVLRYIPDTECEIYQTL